MNNRRIIIISILLATVALILFAVSLFSVELRTVAPLTGAERFVLVPNQTLPPLLPPVDPAAMQAKNLFIPQRGQLPPPPPEVKPEPAPDPAAEVAKLNQLGAYPDDWPRLMLTGAIQEADGSWRAIITGGNNFTVAGGDRYPGFYRVGDTISGNLVLAAVQPRSAIIQQGGNALTIQLGVKPPDPPPKK